MLDGVQTKGSLALEKQVTFALASTLTALAKESQTAVIDELQGTFTLRNNWYQPSNKFGIRITPASKSKLRSEVRTAADWLKLHEEGGTKTPGRRHIAVPTSLVRRTKRQMIGKAQRPRNLKRSFKIETKSGPVLFQRRNKKTIVPLYNLEPHAKIRKQSTLFEPTVMIVDRRFGEVFYQQLKKAFSTAK